VRLQSSHLFPIFESVLALSHVEDHGMGMKLGRSIAIDGRAVSCSKVAAMNFPVVSGAWTLPIRASVYRSSS